MKNLLFLLIISLSIFTCQKQGDSSYPFIPSPKVSTAIVAYGSLNGEYWAANLEYVPNLIDGRINFSLKEFSNSPCPDMIVSFINVPLAIDSYELKNYPTSNPVETGKVTTIISMACGDVIIGSYMLDESMSADFVIEEMDDSKFKGFFNATYELEFGTDLPSDLSSTLTFENITFEIPR